MPTWTVDPDNRRIIRKPEITPAPRPFAQQLRDEVLTIVAWAIPAGMVLALVLAWWYGEGR